MSTIVDVTSFQILIYTEASRHLEHFQTCPISKYFILSCNVNSPLYILQNWFRGWSTQSRFQRWKTILFSLLGKKYPKTKSFYILKNFHVTFYLLPSDLGKVPNVVMGKSVILEFLWTLKHLHLQLIQYFLIYWGSGGEAPGKIFTIFKRIYQFRTLKWSMIKKHRQPF